jgi:hypothetical protein
MAYDPTDGYLVLFGGCLSGNFWYSTCIPSNQTWVFQNNSWTQLATNPTPPARYYASMAWDGADEYMVLFGGNGSGSTGFLNDTWTFLHGHWTQLTPAVSPGARAAAGMAYDAHDGYLVLVDGEQYRTLVNLATETYVGADYNDTWTFSAGNWTHQSTVDNPSARDSFGITYDPSIQSVVVFGGFNWTTYSLDDTWVYQAGNWGLVPSTYLGTPPGDRNNGALAFDPGVGAVLFGGHTGYQYYNDTWIFANGTWNGTSFAGPSPRWGGSLAYDPLVGCLIEFGGYVPSNGSAFNPMPYSNQTWGLGCPSGSGNGSSGNGSSGHGSSGGGSSGNGSSGNGSGNGSGGNGLGGGGLANHREFGNGPATPGGWIALPTVGTAIFMAGVGGSTGVSSYLRFGIRRGGLP